MIAYRIIHYIPGCIMIEVFSPSGFQELSKQLSDIFIPEGIEDIRLNPFSGNFSGNMVITYEPGKIDIIEYIKSAVSSMELKKLTGG